MMQGRPHPAPRGLLAHKWCLYQPTSLMSFQAVVGWRE
jgi:hypothetical protein